MPPLKPKFEISAPGAYSRKYGISKNKTDVINFFVVVGEGGYLQGEDNLVGGGGIYMEVICMGCNGGDYAWWGIMYGGVCVGGGEGWRGNCPWDLRYILPQLVIHSLYLCG